MTIEALCHQKIEIKVEIEMEINSNIVTLSDLTSSLLNQELVGTTKTRFHEIISDKVGGTWYAKFAFLRQERNMVTVFAIHSNEVD